MPAPCLRVTVMNDNFNKSTAIVCTCTLSDQKILHTELPQMRDMAREKTIENDLMKALSSLTQVKQILILCHALEVIQLSVN